MPRFALIVHDSPRGLHYDFFLENGEVLKTWALPHLPEPGLEIACDRLVDHRSIYLDYEGPISGGRGRVTRWDQGTFVIATWTDAAIIVELAGAKLAGRVELRLEAGQWRFNWQPGDLSLRG
ncbi:MAG: DNA polymerase ligase N-terminal domain-containing protein [Thermoguttaceae bacterium]|jgi:hypothetical protein